MKVIGFLFGLLAIGAGISCIYMWWHDQQMSLAYWWSPVFCNLTLSVFLFITAAVVIARSTGLSKKIPRIFTAGTVLLCVFVLLVLLSLILIS